MVNGDSGFTLRVVSALAMMPVALGLVILGGWPFACLVGLAVVLMACEWRQLTEARFGGHGGILAAASVAGLGLLVVLLAASGWPLEGLLALLAGALGAALIAWHLGAPPLWIGLGAAYLALPALALVWLRNLPEFGTAFGGSYRRIVQTPGGITIFSDQGQGQGYQRNIVMSGTPHLPSSVRQWWGDSRGRWDGNTLVIDVTNFSEKSNYGGAHENLHLIERWTRTKRRT